MYNSFVNTMINSYLCNQCYIFYKWRNSKIQKQKYFLLHLIEILALYLLEISCDIKVKDRLLVVVKENL